MSGPVSTEGGDHNPGSISGVGHLSRYMTSHPRWTQPGHPFVGSIWT